MAEFIYLFIAMMIRHYFGGIVLNLAGFIGAGLAVLGNMNGERKFQFYTGVSIAGLAQAYFNLAYTAFIVNFVHLRIENGDTSQALMWTMAVFAVFGPMAKDVQGARIEDNENNLPFKSPAVYGVEITSWFTYIGFFLFIFFPDLMKTLWSWVPYVTEQFILVGFLKL